MNLSEAAIIILIIIIAAMVEYYKLKKHAYKHNAKNDKTPQNMKKQKLYNTIKITVSIFTVAVVLGLLYLSVKVQTEVTIDKENITFSAGFLEKCKYKTNDIYDVSLRETIPSVSKVVGTSFGSLKRGVFDVEGLGRGHLYIETDRGPYLYIMLKDSFIIISYKDPEKTRGLYKMITQYQK